MSRLRLALAALMLTAAAPSLFAQHYSGIPTFGRDFYATVITTAGYCPGQLNFITYRLLLNAPSYANVNISYFDASSGHEYYAGSYRISPLGSI